MIQEGVAFEYPEARVNGASFSAWPKDLYIPPEALEVFLDQFEGPLDLLLYLIRKHQIDVLDIPLAALTEQYMAYVRAMERHQLHLAADYLVMAAWLIEQKVRFLLPAPETVGDQEAEEDPRWILAQRLLAYEKMKAAALRLQEHPQQERDFLVARAVHDGLATLPEPGVGLADLRRAWQQMGWRLKRSRHHRITREALSVRETMTRILNALKQCTHLTFQDLCLKGHGRSHLVIHFVAVLELVRESLVEVTQIEALGPLHLRGVGQTEEAVGQTPA